MVIHPMKRARHMNMNDLQIQISSLTTDVQTIISSFLDTKDALMYSRTCKQIRDALDFRIISNVNTIQYHNHQSMDQSTAATTSNSIGALLLCRELIPSLPNMIGKHAMHSYRIRCEYEESKFDNQTFFIKNKSNELVALFIVNCDNKEIILIPTNADQSYYLCHHPFDDVFSNESHKINFHVDVLVHGIRHQKNKTMLDQNGIRSPLKLKETKYLLNVGKE